MEGLKRQREEEARVSGQLFAKKRGKCGPALLRRERGRFAIIKRSPVRATSADRSIVSRNALLSFQRFSRSAP